MRNATSSPGRRWIQRVAVALAFAAVTFTLSVDLGADALAVDEVFQVFAARSLVEGRGPVMPTGQVYDRGIDVTRAVALSFRMFGDNELAARLPNLLLGLVALGAFAAGLWWLAGAYAAVWGILLLGFFPEFVYQARHLRFYTYLLAFTVPALFTGWLALRHSHQPEDRRGREWGWTAVTVGLLLMAARVQVVSLTVLLGFGTAVAAAAAAALYKRGRAAFRTSGPVQMVALVVVGTVAALVLAPSAVLETWRMSQRVGPWAADAQAGVTAELAYYYLLSESMPTLLALAPAVFAVLALRRPRLAAYLALWFGVPLLILSFVLPWKGARFLLPALPALFAAAAIVIAWAAGALKEAVQARVVSMGRRERTGRVAGGAVVTLAAVFAVLTMPAIQRAWDLTRETGASESRNLAEIINASPELHGLPVGGADPLHTLYYAGKLDFAVGWNRYLAEMTEEEIKAQVAPSHGEWLDPIAGVPPLYTPEAIRMYFPETPALVVTRSIQGLHEELRASLLEEGEELCKGRCGGYRLYYLPLPENRSARASG